MAFLKKMEFIPLPNVRIVGREVVCSLDPIRENPVPALWEQSFADGTIGMLKQLPLALEGCTIGRMGDVKGQDYRYIAGVIAKEGTPVPEGMQYRDLPACQVAKGYIHGNLQNGDVYGNAHQLTLEGIAAHHYQYDYSFGWSAEVYPDDLDFDSEEGTVCYFQPCKEN
ncbi:MAG: GyrI-like domain-containing protein [Acutalibacter sp.]|nr:GyrI-like domain-containing protein [Acutalibacter sp.]